MISDELAEAVAEAMRRDGYPDCAAKAQNGPVLTAQRPQTAWEDFPLSRRAPHLGWLRDAYSRPGLAGPPGPDRPNGGGSFEPVRTRARTCSSPSWWISITSWTPAPVKDYPDPLYADESWAEFAEHQLQHDPTPAQHQPDPDQL
jgi:hypothetical protein